MSTLSPPLSQPAHYNVEPNLASCVPWLRFSHRTLPGNPFPVPYRVAGAEFGSLLVKDHVTVIQPQAFLILEATSSYLFGDSRFGASPSRCLPLLASLAFQSERHLLKNLINDYDGRDDETLRISSSQGSWLHSPH